MLLDSVAIENVSGSVFCVVNKTGNCQRVQIYSLIRLFSDELKDVFKPPL